MISLVKRKFEAFEIAMFPQDDMLIEELTGILATWYFQPPK